MNSMYCEDALERMRVIRANLWRDFKRMEDAIEVVEALWELEKKKEMEDDFHLSEMPDRSGKETNMDSRRETV